MKHCPNCGKKLKNLPSSSTWECRQECRDKKCGWKVRTIYGDPMGGSRDQVSFPKEC